MVKNNYEKEDIQYLKKLKTFEVNEYTKINKFKADDKNIYTFNKFGEPSKYLKFTGEIKKQKVKGYINIDDNNIYQLEKVKNDKYL